MKLGIFGRSNKHRLPKTPLHAFPPPAFGERLHRPLASIDARHERSLSSVCFFLLGGMTSIMSKLPGDAYPSAPQQLVISVMRVEAPASVSLSERQRSRSLL